jgi:hypothetical protein
MGTAMYTGSAEACIPELFLAHSEIVPDFVQQGLADLLAHFIFTGAHGFNVFL